MAKAIFWDVDTQYDFMMSNGKLYVPESEEIVPNLAQLTRYAESKNIQIIGSVDYHRIDDEEISDNPDYHRTFPPHCLQGTPGQEKIEATKPRNPLWVESHKYDRKEVERMVGGHRGEIIFRKQLFDVFSNPNVDAVLDIVRPEHIVLYGVALDVCDAYAIEGLLERGKYKIHLVEDATKPIYKDKGEELVKKWRSGGVRVIKAEDVVKKEYIDRINKGQEVGIGR